MEVVAKDEVWDVIVVGAGLAGLKAALELKKAGKRILLLEARDRVGGRSKAGEICGAGGRNSSKSPVERRRVWGYLTE